MADQSLPELPCLCANLRRAARALTKTYEEHLRPLNLSSSQLTILQVLSRMGELSQGTLGGALAMDSTTLTRTLRTMAAAGWIGERRGADRREKLLALSRAGTNLLQRALPAWEKAQAHARNRVGEQRWSDLQKLLNQITAITAE